MNEYNKIETDPQIEQISGYQWEEGREEGKDKARSLTGTNYYVYNK